MKADMIVSEQPGRVFAVLVLAPVMLWMGMAVQRGDHTQRIGTVLMVFAVLFALYELFWLSCATPRRCILPPHRR